ncbi:hypothetical protein [Enteractinococcus helveticum]|uniref:hypothetical protein n=1 Tax=Enteractinococcus helveticum TaxID=1837282 RepID=UPI000AE71595|nr:hypothetical protein [Enteractinococcus helveticum]
MSSPTRAVRTAVALFGAYVVSQAYIAALLRPLGRDVLRVQTTGDPDEFCRIMTGWSPEQRLQYRKHLLPDTLHPLLYASALAAAGIAGHEPSTPRWVRIVAVAAPAASAVCDLSENALHARFVNHPHRVTREAARASTLLTRTKWVLACGTAGALITRTLRKRRSAR